MEGRRTQGHGSTARFVPTTNNSRSDRLLVGAVRVPLPWCLIAKKRREFLVDLIGIEPMTSSMPWKRAPSCATGPQRQQHPLFWRSMPNPSNALHVATYPSPLSLGERMFPSPRSSKFSLLTLFMYSGVFLSSTAAYAQAPAPAPPAG